MVFFPPSTSTFVFLLNLHYEMIKLRLAKRHVVSVDLGLMKMTDCNSMLAVLAKTLITSWQTLYWISLWRMLSWKSPLNCCNTTRTTPAITIIVTGSFNMKASARLRWDHVFLSIWSDWRWDESAAVVVKVIWPRYDDDGCISSGCPSISNIHPSYWLWTLNSQH